MARGRITAGSGRRGYYLYQFGTHLWVPETQADFSLGMFRDTSRPAIPAGGVYDSLDLMLHKPGVAFKRGGTSYAGPAASGATYMQAVSFVQFPGYTTSLVTISGGGALTIASSSVPRVPQLLGVGNNGHLYLIASAGTQDLGTMSSMTKIRDKPKFFVGGATNLLWTLDGDGQTAPQVYGGTQVGPTGVADNISPTSTLTHLGTVSGGTFTLQIGVTGVTGTVTTGNINWNATAANVQTALNAVSTGYVCTGGPLPGSDVTITSPLVNLGSFGFPYGQGYLGVTVTNSAITGGGGITLTRSDSATTVPTAVYGETHLSRMVLANTRTNPNRLWFGPLTPNYGIGTIWDTANAYIDVGADAISGLASLGGTLLIFTQKGFWRIDGDTPPPGTNMTLRPVDVVGCTDARSITVNEGTCYFANPRAVYSTTGTGATSLMAGRIESYWQSLFTSYDADTWTISTGIYARRFLQVTVLDASRTLVTSLICDLQRNSWGRHSRPTATMYANAYGASEELYAASADTNRVTALSGMYTPTSSNKNDADGTAVTCSLETRPFGGSPQVFAFGHGEIALDMRDAASDNPTMAVQYANGVEATTYATVSDGSPIAETTDETRKRIAVNQDSQAVSLKLTQSAASSKTEIYAVQVDTRSYPAGAGGQ